MTAAAAQITLPLIEAGQRPEKRRLPQLPLAALLDAQRTLTAVERFARRHDNGEAPLQAKHYRDLIPLERPRSNEQYAFEVDLDACTGCKACVSACHTLNGLDETEIWRTVGLLHGGTSQSPAVQTVTTSCHHCLEPACLSGCPVQAYEKDPITGIVKHLDDQCIGCQYCTLMCPYDAPKYNKSRGIVRKCDMCSSRLALNEAPACVQACPNEAIAIRVVDKAHLGEACQGGGFLPGAPASDHTLPSTVYKTKRAMPSNMLPADFYHTKPEHSHPPLVIMLILTQLAVGAFGLALLVERTSDRPPGSSLAQTAFASALALVALAASIFHLGRPWLAWRVFLGLRTSWLSREAIAFGVFAQLGVLYGLLTAAPMLPNFPGKHWAMTLTGSVQAATAISGVFGVFFSVMVYVATQRAHWSGTQTGVKFFGTTILLGAASVLSVYVFTGGTLDRLSQNLLTSIILITILKLAFEASVLFQYRNRRHTALKRVAILMLGDLSLATRWRFGCALFGGVLLPIMLQNGMLAHFLPIACGLLLTLLMAGESLERYLFFRAAPASRMPGGIR